MLPSLIGNDVPTLQGIKDCLGVCFDIRDLGDASYILGIRFIEIDISD